MNINIYNKKAEEVGKLDLPEDKFGVKANNDLLHQVMVAQMSNERQVLAHTKTRGEVSGGGKKPWRQKGTGRARAGSNRSPIWIGGGVTFGPLKERNFKKDINRKMKRKAVYMVLSDRLQNGNLAALDEIKADKFSTKAMDEMIAGFEKKVWKSEAKEKRSLLVINSNNETEAKVSLRNLAGVKVINADNINILDLLKYKKLMVAKTVLVQIAGEKEDKTAK